MKGFKKSIVAVACAASLAVLPACVEDGGQTDRPGAGEVTKITLWTYPVGGWGKPGTVSQQLAAFHRDHPEIHVSVGYVDYVTGDAEVENAIQSGNAPDIILEGPERLVANWGARGYMADISDLWQTDKANAVYENVKVACHNAAGEYFIYPMCMTTHCMAINREMFEAADAWKYVDEETHTWTTENFFAAVETLHNSGIENVAAVYCGGQGGDQGTRALVNNLYSGTFTNKEHTAYTVNSENNIRALEKLKNTPGIVFDDSIVGAEEIEKFCNRELAMAFCWNVSAEVGQTVDGNLNFDAFPMAFPTDDANFNLQGGIWGFGVFDNGDEARIKAAKTFIEYYMQDDSRYSSAVSVSNYLPARPFPDLYANDRVMSEYSVFSEHMGDYYQITPGWAEARKAWYEMLAEIGGGADVRTAVEEFDRKMQPAAEQ